MKTIAAIDIGTNSIRLGVHHIDKNHHYNTIAIHKEVVRLGQGEFAHHKITRPAMERGLLVIKKFADIARKYDASEIVAVATAAVREAENKLEFVDRARSECGVDIKVVSGMEEARLIYLGVASGIELNSHRALFMDIGGGTTELIIGDAKEHHYLESLKLGAIRLADIFLRGKTGSVSKKKYRNMLDYVRGATSHAYRRVRDLGFDMMVGSSGTIENLAEITAKRLEGGVGSIRNYELKYQDLVDTVQMLCDLNLEERRNVPGINPERADIIISGAAILDAVMSGIGADKIVVSDRALRDGIVIDRLFQEEKAREQYVNTSPRYRSVMEMCRACNFEETHAIKVADLSQSIFRQLRDLNLHNYGDTEEELLRYASLAHDVGAFISHGDHHKHSYYIIRNWNLLGFSDEEVETLATAAQCHRKAPPKKVASRRLNSSSLRALDVMASILRVSDALDRSQMGLVNEVVCHHDPQKNRMIMEVFAQEDCPLELWWLDNKKKLFEQTFELDLDARLVVISR